ncbi:MAG: pyridoxamine 5'-phosphate oxidase family protein [Prevotella sp.]|uniref:pyridoxamine 5'-phosphate oxidase family protein n=1 Tax=Prevotella sp. TaxID=59823 RepID=UPI002A2D1B34|nr:pyridoxamine 5'-phosphate oxidase family protein [Prevotella sp.]MDD7318481.1 pyridoxamine 5'-phosphate oxidase family protein [Prevotellaceae bacterium]MDY4020168.1 pyridoxamine 5'-phosphate oxidase family protein [Prevotella sp.]
MEYDNSGVRRQDRLLDEASAVKLLRESEYGVLSMIDENGLPYAVPVNHIWDGGSSIYIHCAPEGRKLRAIKSHPEVSFCVVGHTNLLPNKFTTEYESIVISGKASIGLTEEERWHALELLLDKLSPNDKTIGLKYSEKSFHRVDIIRIDIEKWSGKAKRVT